MHKSLNAMEMMVENGSDERKNASDGRKEEEYRRAEEEYCRKQEEYRQEEEEYSRQQDAKPREQPRAMQEQRRQQLKALKHMEKRLPRREQMYLVRQLKMQSGERPENEKKLAVVTHAQEERIAQQRKDPLETGEENPEEKDTAVIQEVIPHMQVGVLIYGQESGEEIFVDKDCRLGIEFPVDGEMFGKPGKPRTCLARTKKGSHNQQWTGPDDSTASTQLKKDQEQQAITETKLKEPESNRMEMSHTTVRPETVTAESKQQASELETMR